MSDDEDVNELKATLQRQREEFESFKEDAKQIEKMLEEDLEKKELEIRQLKEEAIKKQKGQKMMKSQLSQFQAEIQNLKSQLGEHTKNESSSNNSKQQLDRLSKESLDMRQKADGLEQKVHELTLLAKEFEQKFQSSQKQVKQLQKLLTEAQKKQSTSQESKPSLSTIADTKHQQQISKLKQKLNALQKQRAKYQKVSKEKQAQKQKQRSEYEQKIKKLLQQNKQIKHKSTHKEERSSHKEERSSHKEERSSQKVESKRQTSEQKEFKQIKQTISLSEHRAFISKYKQTIQNLQTKCEENQHLQHQYKGKLQSLHHQKNSLLQKIKSQNKQLQREKEKVFKLQSSPQHFTQSPRKQIAQDTAQYHSQVEDSGVVFDCLLVTKKHYISPFIEIKDRIIKLYKNTKTGFQKSLGSTKHRFNCITYDPQLIIDRKINLIKQNQSDTNHHSIIIYGAKGTSKKRIMAGLVQRLKEWISQKIDESASESQQTVIKCAYIEKNQEDQQITQRQALNNKEEILSILEEVSSLDEKGSPSKSQIKLKKSQQGRIRYLGLSIGDHFSLQIITTSFLNPFIKNNETLTDYINTIAFSKLSSVLQSSQTNYHIIATLNPIVNLYQECKNTLSITLVPLVPSRGSLVSETVNFNESSLFSPSAINKQDLNDLTKKKLQTFQKSTQQASIKVRKVEEQCNYYLNRFEQLQVRLKNLINTHQQQNAYLKKSPVTLSYEKLLKFVNTVLARNNSLNSSRGLVSANFGQANHQEQVNIYIEQDAKSLDGY